MAKRRSTTTNPRGSKKLRGKLGSPKKRERAAKARTTRRRREPVE